MQWLDTPMRYPLTAHDVRRIDTGLSDLLRAETGVDPAAPTSTAATLRQPALPRRPQVLPPSLRTALQTFQRGDQAAAFHLTGFPVDDIALGPTPATWAEATAPRQELFLTQVAACLGEVFGWPSLQDGRLVRHILPMKGYEDTQSGHGAVGLDWHSEDAFHPRRCAYLLLMGLRNHDHIPTTLASARDLQLAGQHRTVLDSTRFLIRPDDQHIEQLQVTHPRHPALAVMRRRQQAPAPVAVLSTDPATGQPHLRLDHPFMAPRLGDQAAEQALNALDAELDRVQQNIVIGPGEILIIDNRVAVHGRAPFTPRHDGTDRWLLNAQAR